jgi:hypothetical protein
MLCKNSELIVVKKMNRVKRYVDPGHRHMKYLKRRANKCFRKAKRQDPELKNYDPDKMLTGMDIA